MICDQISATREGWMGLRPLSSRTHAACSGLVVMGLRAWWVWHPGREALVISSVISGSPGASALTARLCNRSATKLF